MVKPSSSITIVSVEKFTDSSDWRIYNSDWINEIDGTIDVTATLFLLVQNRKQTHDWTLIGSGANGHQNFKQWVYELWSDIQTNKQQLQLYNIDIYFLG